MKLSVVIVNYNVKYFLEQTLRSLRKALVGIAAEVFVVDNASVDGSVALLQKEFPEVRLIANRDNVGFSRANNQAIRLSQGQYVLLLNPDTVVPEDGLHRCLAFMDAHPEAGALGVKMIDGSGHFLPESKRGFPTPFVAFCKTVGLSKLFPRSPYFNRYHLGYLDKEQTHRVDVLSGAFMLLRKTVLDEIGLLDETFFMYGEDIDLSYRVKLAGYENYYFADAAIIHYKGESTKKGSLNYVRVFYQAMIIFAQKHFAGPRGQLFVLMLRGAIYLRAGLTLARNLWLRWWLPLLEGLLFWAGLLLAKNFWASYHFQQPDYFEGNPSIGPSLLAYVGTWLLATYLSGGYDRPFGIVRSIRGLLFASLFLLAAYGLLDAEYRFSRAILLLGAAWAIGSSTLLRLGHFFWKNKHLRFTQSPLRKLLLVGSAAEGERVRHLLGLAQVSYNYIGRVAPGPEAGTLGSLDQLGDIVRVYGAEEVIFCAKDVSSQQIMDWMGRLGRDVATKIVPEDSASIIGSPSKNSNGELYTIEVRYRLADADSRRNKLLLDWALALLLALLWPLLAWHLARPWAFWRHWAALWWRRRTWVGYAPQAAPGSLPALPPGVLHPALGLGAGQWPEGTLERLNFFYAKDYSPWQDLRLVLRHWRHLG